MKLGFIGLGIMGKPMVKNLLKAGYEVTVYDIIKENIKAVTDAGAMEASSAKEVAQECRIIITMLPNSPHVKQAVMGENGVLEGAEEGTILIDMSSIAPLASQEIAKACEEKGVRMIDAPVSGGEPKAVDGTLSIMAGGSEEVFKEVYDILLVMGGSAVHCGEIGAGNTTKLANQVIVALNIAAVSEAFMLSTRAGVDPEKVFRAIRGGLAGSTVMDAKVPMITAGDFKPGFKIDLHIKDLNNALETGHGVGAPLPLTAQVMEILQNLRMDGCGQEAYRQSDPQWGGRKMSVAEKLQKMFSLEGKTVLFTGAAGGIGSAIASGMAEAGGKIALCDINKSQLEKVQSDIEAQGGTASCHQMDVTDKENIRKCVEEAVGLYGQIDVLVNCAGINKREGFMDVDEETYDRIMDINLKGVFLVTQAVAPYMKNQKSGSIINIGSHNTGSILGGCAVYGATKCGVLSFTRSMAVEWAKYNIRANCVSPGHIQTALTVPTWEHPVRAKYLLERIALNRPGYPEDITGVCILLASDASSYITGTEIRVDGGCIAGGQPWPYDTAF